MAKMFQVYGIGQALIPVLPPPLPFENAPTSHQTNYEIGQLVFSPAVSPTAFYLYGGAGNWIQFANSSGDIIAIDGTTNQITVTTVSGVATISLPSTLVAPGSIASTTTITAATGLTVTSGGATITAGGLTVTAGGAGITGTTNINTTGAAVTSIGTGGTGAVHIGNATGNTAVTGSLTASTTLTATAGAITATNGNLVLGTAGNKLSIATGSNASIGTSGAMTSGAVTVSNTSVTANSIIFVQPAVLGTVTSPQAGYVSSKSAGTSFTITSAGATDTSTWNYLIIN
jgi:hypothetical protein